MADPVYCTGCEGCAEGEKHESCQCPLGPQCTCDLETCRPSAP